ncbi:MULTISPECIES: DMT family transporter [unclassified Halomonas]|uniref:DMT family transporter n=1 Tax=unclassified Halomonas TaxID=2609666 RepID=UPI0009905122|nr:MULTISPECIES: DMT family transporter [unclassified Halomonas]AQU82804.1 EamA family transporter [Halomonas sp. 'Soap Lake \
MKRSLKSLSGHYYVLIIASTFLQGSSFVSTKVVMEQMSPLWAASARFLIAAVFLSPVVFIQMRRHKILIKDLPWVKLLIIGGFQTAGVMSLLNIGLTATTSSIAAILMASNPLLVVVLAWLILGERSSKLALLGLAFAFAGVVICIGINTDGSHAIGHGEVFVMLASTCWACSTVLSKKFAITLSPWIVTFWQMLFGSLLLIAIAALSKQPFSLPTDAYHWGMFMWLAIPASTGAIGLWFAALKIGGSVHTSGFLFLCPLFAALIAFILIGQHPAWHEIIGGVLVGAGLFIMSRKHYACGTALRIKSSHSAQ